MGAARAALHLAPTRACAKEAVMRFVSRVCQVLPVAIVALAQGAAPAVADDAAAHHRPVLHGGTVFPGDRAPRGAQATAVGGARVVGVGPSPPLLAAAPAGTTRIDLGGRLVIPG